MAIKKIHEEIRLLDMLKCNPKINIKIVSPDLFASNGQKKFTLSEEAIEDAVLNKDHYGATEHKCRKGLPSGDEDGFCDSSV